MPIETQDKLHTALARALALVTTLAAANEAGTVDHDATGWLLQMAAEELTTATSLI